jgi:hypothetical protein
MICTGSYFLIAEVHSVVAPYPEYPEIYSRTTMYSITKNVHWYMSAVNNVHITTIIMNQSRLLHDCITRAGLYSMWPGARSKTRVGHTVLNHMVLLGCVAT